MIDNIDALIKTNKVPPVLMLFGEEDFLLEEAYHQLMNHLLKDESSKFDYENIDTDNTTIDILINKCMAYPFISNKRIVSVTNFEKFFTGRSSKKIDEKSPLTRYLNNPQTSTTLILITKDDSMNGLKVAMKNSKQKAKAEKIINSAKYPYNLLLEKHEWIEFPRIWENEFPDWIINRCKKFGKEIQFQGAELLTAHCNPTLRDINNEIDKLLIYIQDKKNITTEDINFVIGSSRVYNVFELQKAIGKRNIPNSISILENLLAVDRQEMLIITVLTRYFIVLFKLIEESRNNTNQFQLAAKLGVSPMFIPDYQAALKKYNFKEIERAFVALTEADEILKTSSTDSVYVLQKMLIKIMDN